MTINYEIIKNKEALKAFIEWLPELEEDEIFYVCLFGRKKYCPELKHSNSDKTQLKRLTTNKKYLMNRIQQLECPVGSYSFKDMIVPQEALVCYITVNPRNLKKATANAAKKLVDLLCRDYNGWNPHQEVISEIQKCKSKTRWVDFDLDVKYEKEEFEDMKKRILYAVNKEAIKIMETYSGYHVLVAPDKVSTEFRDTWYKELQRVLPVDQLGDIMIPIVGCTQGNFVPKFIAI